MLAGTRGRATVRERHAVDRLDSLGKDPAHERAPAVHGRQLVAQPQVAHARPSRRRLDLRVQRLGFAHTRASGDDDEVRGLETRGLEIELLEAGGDAGDVLLPLVEALDVLEGVPEDPADRERAAFEPALGEAEDP